MLSWAWTMILVTLAWVFFRSPDMKHALAYLARMFGQAGNPGLPIVPVPLMLTAPLMFVVEWTTRAREHPLAIADRPAAIRWSTYFTLTFLTLFLFDDRSTFIYFQF